MARTKKAEFRRISTLLEVKSVALLPGQELPQSHSSVANHDEEAMELEGQDEYPSDVDNIHPPSAILGFSKTDQIMEIYHQSPITSLQDTSDLWRLPVTPNFIHRSAYESLGITHPTAILYHHSCRIIRNNWKSEPSACIPDDIRKQTPYSLAMLYQIRQLSARTKHDFALAHSLLIDAWRERFHNLTIPGDHTSLYVVETIVDGIEECEHKVQENVFGLMLQDVSLAVKTLGEYSNIAQRQAKMAAQDARRRQPMREVRLARHAVSLGPFANKVTKRGGRRGRKRNQDVLIDPDELQDSLTSHTDFDYDGTQGTSMVPPNSPELASHPVHQLPPNGVTPQEQAKGTASIQQMDEAGSQLSKREWQNYNQLRKLMNKTGIEWSLQSNKKRLERLRTGGLSRHGHGLQPVTLPSERSDLNNLPSLHTMALESRPKDLSGLGERPLPEQEENVTRSMKEMGLDEPKMS